MRSCHTCALFLCAQDLLPPRQALLRNTRASRQSKAGLWGVTRLEAWRQSATMRMASSTTELLASPHSAQAASKRLSAHVCRARQDWTRRTPRRERRRWRTSTAGWRSITGSTFASSSPYALRSQPPAAIKLGSAPAAMRASQGARPAAHQHTSRMPRPLTSPSSAPPEARQEAHEHRGKGKAGDTRTVGLPAARRHPAAQ